jgi:hypothetical protein
MILLGHFWLYFSLFAFVLSCFREKVESRKERGDRREEKGEKERRKDKFSLPSFHPKPDSIYFNVSLQNIAHESDKVLEWEHR